LALSRADRVGGARQCQLIIVVRRRDRACGVLDTRDAEGIAVAALTGHAGTADPVAAWLDAGGERVARIRERLQALTEGGDITVSRLSVASGLMSDLTGM
ncbi:hypothetical protein, partial [Mesorhizobium sp. M7A.F.Ca.ET.027.03.2.1]|uniref:hypothetical protein n=1 Tax=Mesorhizobium sp. M7A.F.Ca.ET.027.03.2.1 TaxID=2496656 RepID=UPI001AECF7D5